MRLDKFLSAFGVGTRSQVKKILKQGSVTVNGQPVCDGKLQIDSEKDSICYQGKKLAYEEFIYYVFHKPGGCVCAGEDAIHDTVFRYVPMNEKKDLFTVGRLDLDTEGLLLITNDGAFSQSLLSPRKHVDKTYFAILDAAATEDDVAAFARGLHIGDDKDTRPAKLEINPKDAKQVYITIAEGRYHQIKRMANAVGKEVTYLKRLTMGRFILDDTLKPGEYRKFTEEELAYVREYKSCSV